MHILPYSNYLNQVFLELKEKSNQLIQPHFQNFSIHNYASLTQNISAAVQELARHLITTTLEDMDNDYRVSELRKRYYHVKCTRERTLVTLFGPIRFNRTIYQAKDTNKCFTYVDEKLGLPKYDRYDPLIKAKVVELYANQNSMIKVGSIIGEQIYSTFSLNPARKQFNICRQTVHNIVKSTLLFAPPKQTQSPKEVNTIYIMADEKFIPVQQEGDRHKVMVKHGVIFEDIEVVHNRVRLTNKHVHSTIGGDFWDNIDAILHAKYDMDKVEQIVIMGDGASWIKSGTFSFVHSSFVLDTFHAFQACNRITPDEDYRQALQNTIKTNMKPQFISIVDSILNQTTDTKRQESIQSNYDYLLNNWYSLQKNFTTSNPGCSMEAHISHNLAAVFTSRPKAYSVKHLKHYILYRDLYQNGVDIQNLFLDTLHFDRDSKPLQLEKEVLDFSMFDPKPLFHKSSTSNWLKGFISKV